MRQRKCRAVVLFEEPYENISILRASYALPNLCICILRISGTREARRTSLLGVRNKNNKWGAVCTNQPNSDFPLLNLYVILANASRSEQSISDYSPSILCFIAPGYFEVVIWWAIMKTAFDWLLHVLK